MTPLLTTKPLAVFPDPTSAIAPDWRSTWVGLKLPPLKNSNVPPLETTRSSTVPPD